MNVIKYDGRLDAHILPASDLDNYSIEMLNSYPYPLIIDFPNTKGITKKFLNQIDNENISYRVVGGYDKNKVNHWTNRNLQNETIRIGKKRVRGLTYLEDANIYDQKTMIGIIDAIENIEKDIHWNWSDMKKVLYVYYRLREEMIYDPKYEEKASVDIRTLRGLISRKTVCAGYALIFKEFMDRLNIPCAYVEGFSPSAKDTLPSLDFKNLKSTNHAWNIVKIHGHLFPIDLTWDAGKYRNGDFNSFDNFSRVDNFRKRHFPYVIESLQDYSRLSGVKRSYVRRIIDSFKPKKKIIESKFYIDTTDSERVYVAQLEKIENVRSHGDSMYRYVVARKDNNGKFIDYRMVYSEVNMMAIVKAYQWGNKSKIPSSNKLQAYRRLFSYSNIDRARKDGSSYIGNVVEKFNSANRYVVQSKKTTRKRYSCDDVEYVKKNGEHYLVSQMKNGINLDMTWLYSGFVGSFCDGGYKEYRVMSEYPLAQADPVMGRKNIIGYQDILFDEEYLDKRTKYGGYLGMIGKDGKRTGLSEISEYFRTTKSDDMTDIDIILPGSVYNSKSVDKIDFDSLRDICLKYEIKAVDSDSLAKVIDKDNGNVVTDKSLETICRFANNWRWVAGTKSWPDEEIHGVTCAFNEGSAMVYDYLIKNCLKSLEETGTIDFSRFDEEDMLSQGYECYKYTDQILASLLQYPHLRKSVFDFCKLQVDAYKNDGAYKLAQSFTDSLSSYQIRVCDFFDYFQNEPAKPCGPVQK